VCVCQCVWVCAQVLSLQMSDSAAGDAPADEVKLHGKPDKTLRFSLCSDNLEGISGGTHKHTHTHTHTITHSLSLPLTHTNTFSLYSMLSLSLLAPRPGKYKQPEPVCVCVSVCVCVHRRAYADDSFECNDL